MEGNCALTGVAGKFVDCHIIPRSLTYCSKGQVKFVEVSETERPKRAQSSWYDKNLVIDVGEQILSRLDTIGVEILRKHKLIWSSWDSLKNLSDIGGVSLDLNGHRKINLTDEEIRNFRKFLLSLLWRAGSSDLSVCKNVEIPEGELRALGSLISSFDQTDDCLNYPVSFMQFGDLGAEKINTGPVRDDHRITRISDGKDEFVPRFTFYFDGLYVCFGTNPNSSKLFNAMANCALGFSNLLLVPTILANGNPALAHLETQKQHVRNHWPQDSKRLGV